MTKSTIDIRIENHTRRTLPLASLRGHLRDALGLLRIPSGHWSITLITDRAMTELHARTMNLPTTTDVLTFDLRDDTSSASARPRKSPLDLDTVICLDEAARRATELRHPLAHEILLYALHSLLHVQGYDDLTPAQAARMHRREDALLVALGIGPVYAPGHKPPARVPRKPPRSAPRVRKKARS